jgi:uncharacterized membrane protein YjgN (DUF898 family)
MSESDSTAPAAPADPLAAPGTTRFVGPEGPFWRLLVRGAGLLVLTLGLYRFWLVTDVRRYLWLNSEVAGDGLEYIGTARELLLGFLIAIALLVPLNVAFFLAALDLGVLGRITTMFALVFLALLGHFAVYRARRYRLARTLFRGLRFRQTGSAWRYAVSAMIWWTLIVLTFGLVYPWAVASLERLKMDNTHYGDLKGRFEGSAFRLFFRGLLMWLLVMVPGVLGIAAALGTVQWRQLSAALSRGGDVLAELESAGVTGALVYAIMAIAWAILMAALLYPIFQAMVLRWWISGLRFGRIAFTSRLRTSRVYAVYVRFMWYALLAGVVIVILAAMGLLGLSMLEKSGWQPKTIEIATTVFLVLIYVIVALAYSTIYQATVKLRLWAHGFDSLELAGLEHLDEVRAVDAAGSPIGEGLADALNVGGI